MARAGLAKNDENSLSCPMANLFVKIAAAVINGGCVCGLGTRIATSRLRRGECGLAACLFLAFGVGKIFAQSMRHLLGCD